MLRSVHYVVMARPRKIELEEVRARAMAAFWRHGFDGASLSTLEEATETGRRSLLNSFGGKLSLFVEALKDFRQLAASRFLSPMEAESAGLSGIRETLRRLGDEARSNDGQLGCLICNTAREPIAQEPSVHEQIWLYFNRIERAFAKALREAVAAGDLPSDSDIDRLAQSLLGTLVSICTLARAGAPVDMIENIVSEALARLR